MKPDTGKLIYQVTLDIASSTAFRSLLRQQVVLTMDTVTEDGLVSLMQRLLVDPLIVEYIYDAARKIVDTGSFPFAVELIVDIVANVLGRVLYNMVRSGSYGNVTGLVATNLFISAGSTMTSYLIQLSSKMPSVGNCAKNSGKGFIV